MKVPPKRAKHPTSLLAIGALLVLVILLSGYYIHQYKSPIRAITFTHKLFYKSEDTATLTMTYQKAKWHQISRRPDIPTALDCSFIQSNASSLTIAVGELCLVPEKHSYTKELGLATCQEQEDSTSCISESKTLQTIELLTPGHKYTSYEPFNSSQPVDLVAHRESTDSGKTWRYWLTLEEITASYPDGSDNGATSLDGYLGDSGVTQAIAVIKTVRTD